MDLYLDSEGGVCQCQTRTSSARDALRACFKSQEVLSCASIVSGFCRWYSSASLIDRNHKQFLSASLARSTWVHSVYERFSCYLLAPVLHGNWCHILWLMAAAQGLCWCIRAAVIACSKQPLALSPFRRDDVWRNCVRTLDDVS